MTPLHLAIAYGNDELAEVIVAAGADVTVRARGTFFHPADQQNSCPPEDSNYEVDNGNSNVNSNGNGRPAEQLPS